MRYSLTGPRQDARELMARRAVTVVVLSPAELPIIRRGNMTRLRDLKLRCGQCGVRGAGT